MILAIEVMSLPDTPVKVVLVVVFIVELEFKNAPKWRSLTDEGYETKNCPLREGKGLKTRNLMVLLEYEVEILRVLANNADILVGIPRVDAV